MITMKENMCGSVNTRCLQSIASKCSAYQTNFNFFDQTKTCQLPVPGMRSLITNLHRGQHVLFPNLLRFVCL